jgi:hypothetical protein
VLALLDGFAAEAAKRSDETDASPADQFEDLDQAFDAIAESVPEGCEFNPSAEHTTPSIHLRC